MIASDHVLAALDVFFLRSHEHEPSTELRAGSLTAVSFLIVAVVALAERRAGDSCLEAFTVVLLALCPTAIAPFEVELLAVRLLNLDY